MANEYGRKESDTNMNVQKRIKRGFTFLLLLLSLCTAVSVVMIGVVGVTYRTAITNYGFAQGYVGQLGIEFNTMTTTLCSLILEQDEASREELLSQLDEQQGNVEMYLAKVQDVAGSKEEQALIEDIRNCMEEYRSVTDQVTELAVKEKQTAAYALLKATGAETSNRVKSDINALLELYISKCNSMMATAGTIAILMVVILIGVGAFAYLTGKRLSKSISDGICGPLHEIREAAEQLKHGNLNAEITYVSENEIGETAESFRQACSYMRDVIADTDRMLAELSKGNFVIHTSQNEEVYKGDFESLLNNIRKVRKQMNQALINVREASAQVASGAGQMASNAQGLAEGATEQAGAVEELTATINDVVTMVEESAKSAKEAFAEAEHYEQEAEKSSREMAELTDAMAKISEVSEQIGRIISEIENIASQTNLLSLNASIEAARAGEAGKGFAVVADQIGKLATDSAKSAVNTRQLIENSIAEIERGNEITMRTSEALEKVVDGIRRLEENAKRISENADIQAETMKEIEQGVEQISSVVESNSAAAEETSATSQELSAQATTLNSEVEQFHLAEEQW